MVAAEVHGLCVLPTSGVSKAVLGSACFESPTATGGFFTLREARSYPDGGGPRFRGSSGGPGTVFFTVERRFEQPATGHAFEPGVLYAVSRDPILADAVRKKGSTARFELPYGRMAAAGFGTDPCEGRPVCAVTPGEGSACGTADPVHPVVVRSVDGAPAVLERLVLGQAESQPVRLDPPEGWPTDI